MKLSAFLARTYIAERTLTTSSIEQLRISVAHLERFAPETTLESIDHEILNRFIAANPGRWKPRTLRRIVADCLAVVTYAATLELRPFIARHRLRKIHVPRRTPIAWSVEELRALLDACTALPFLAYLPNGVRRGVLLRAVILLGFYSALRLGDLFTLRRDQLRVDGFPIPQHKRRGDEVLVAVPPWVIDYLDAHYPPDIVLAVPWPHRRNRFYDLWSLLLAAAGLPCGRSEGPQKLRRSAVSYAELLSPGAGAVIAGHEPGSRATRQSYIDPRIAVVGRPILPDLRQDTGPRIE